MHTIEKILRKIWGFRRYEKSRKFLYWRKKHYHKTFREYPDTDEGNSELKAKPIADLEIRWQNYKKNPTLLLGMQKLKNLEATILSTGRKKGAWIQKIKWEEICF